MPHAPENDLLVAEELPRAETPSPADAAEPWRVLVVDDDPEVHTGTRMTMGDLRFRDRPLELLSAHSAAEAKDLLAAAPDVAVVLLDVVMESDDAGLRFVHHLRETLGNRTTRIILRTGQPGQAPERRVILEYDINDYRAKTELTAQKLFTSIITALRSYQEIFERQLAERRLQEAHDTLERRVRERTSELQRSHTLLLEQVRERVRAQTSLRRNAESFRALAENLPDILLRFDANGRCIYANPAIAPITGMSPADVIGRSVEALSRDSALCPQLALITRQVLLAGRPHDSRCEYVGPAGARVFDSRVVPEHSARGGGVESALVIFRDITEQHQMEERLRHSEKMEAIGQLAGGVAHDFNNQLSVILGYADILFTRAADPHLRECAQMIVTAVEHSANLTTQLLTYSRKGPHRSIPLDVHKVIREVADFLGRSLDKRIRVQLELTGECARIVGDPTKIQNALLNLAINARDAMPEGGDLLFATGIQMLPEPHAPRATAALTPGRYLRIRVRDTGTGMDEQVRRRLFEPFFTTKAEGKGTGMGLAAVYGTVQSHGGAIAVDTAVGKGTTFTLWLPRGDLSPTDGEEGSRDAATRRAARILLVDDEQAVRNMACDMPGQTGHQATLCSSGPQAVDLVRAGQVPRDLGILDMVMPGMNGRDTFHALRAQAPALPVLLSSGYSVNDDLQELLGEAHTAFLQKPYRLSELAEAIETLLPAGAPAP